MSEAQQAAAQTQATTQALPSNFDSKVKELEEFLGLLELHLNKSVDLVLIARI